MNRLEIGAATALVGAGLYQIHDCYTKHAGALSDVRQADPMSGETLQRLRDADALTGGLTLLAGGAIALATGKVYPLVLAVGAYLFVASYYHMSFTALPVKDSSEPVDTPNPHPVVPGEPALDGW